MSTRRAELYLHISDSSFSVLKNEFDDPPEVYSLFDEFFQHEVYDRPYVLKLLGTAKGENGDSWKIRRLAALMLEHQIVSLPVGNIQEFDFLFTCLNLKP